MSDGTTKRLLRPFIELAPAPQFLSGFFGTPPENFHMSETVEVDVQRDGEKIAIPIQDLSTGNRQNANDVYSNKEFKPPIYKEVVSVSAFQLLGREPGENPFAQPSNQAKAILRAAKESAKTQNKVRRSIELMASQVLTSGTLSLVNQANVPVYVLNFLPKATHVATVGTTWAVNGSAGNPLGDLEALADVIRSDGHREPDVVVFGQSAFQRFLANAEVKTRISRDGVGLGQLAPQKRGTGATFQGFVWIGNYRFEMWTYNGTYEHPNSGNPTPYVATDKLLMLSQGARLDLTFGAVPMIGQPNAALLPALPPRVSDGGLGVDMTLNAWLEPDGQTLSVSVASRPLTVPTEIDSFASLKVTNP